MEHANARTLRRIFPPLCLCAFVPLSLPFLPPGAYCAVSSGADYELLVSVMDNGGGTYSSGGEYLARGSFAQAHMPENIGLLNGGEYINRVGFYNPPHFTYQQGLTTVLAMTANAQLSFPPDSVDKRSFDITVNRDPRGNPLVVDPAKVDEAIRKIVYNEGLWSQPVSNNLMEVAIFDEQGYYTGPLAHRGTVTIRYGDADNDGIVDGSNPPVRVNTLTAWSLDETRNTWVELPGTNADMASQTITAYFDTPGIYALLGAHDLSISRNFKAYPVPFRPNGPQAGSGPGQTGTEAGGITFENAPQGGDIEIYTLDGRLVRKLGIPGDLPMPYSVKWDVRTVSGDKAASGVYIWRVKADANVLTGKLMVIW